MTSFLNYVTATLRALLAWRGSIDYHMFIKLTHQSSLVVWCLCLLDSPPKTSCAFHWAGPSARCSGACHTGSVAGSPMPWTHGSEFAATCWDLKFTSQLQGWYDWSYICNDRKVTKYRYSHSWSRRDVTMQLINTISRKQSAFCAMTLGRQTRCLSLASMHYNKRFCKSHCKLLKITTRNRCNCKSSTSQNLTNLNFRDPKIFGKLPQNGAF